MVYRINLNQAIYSLSMDLSFIMFRQYDKIHYKSNENLIEEKITQASSEI